MCTSTAPGANANPPPASGCKTFAAAGAWCEDRSGTCCAGAPKNAKCECAAPCLCVSCSGQTVLSVTVCLQLWKYIVVAQVAGTQVVLPASNSISAATQAHYIGVQRTYHLIRIDSHPRKPLGCPMLCVGMTNRSRHLSTTAIPCRRELCVCHLRTHPCARTCPHPCAQWYCLRKLRQHWPEV